MHLDMRVRYQKCRECEGSGGWYGEGEFCDVCFGDGLVPVLPDYEAAREAAFGLAVLPSDVERIVNAAWGVDDE